MHGRHMRKVAPISNRQKEKERKQINKKEFVRCQVLHIMSHVSPVTYH